MSNPISASNTTSGLSGQAGQAEPFVRVENLGVRFVSRDMNISVVNGVSFDIAQGEVMCLLGESGSGKSVTMRALMRLLPHTAQITGKVTVGGTDVMAVPEKRLYDIRGNLISMIFQEPLTALDPVFTIGHQIAETVRCHEGVSKATARKRALDLLEMVQIPSAARRLDAYPHELSGGLRQRAMIALALSCKPKLLLADEPTTALDATVQIQVLLLLRELQKELGMATIFVTHDLGVACEVSDKVAVMYAGRFIEEGSIFNLFDRPIHPYTQGLLRSTVHDHDGSDADLDVIPGAPPDLAALPPGCSFAPRCHLRQAACDARMPPLEALSGMPDVSAGLEPALRPALKPASHPALQHAVRCVRADELAGEPAPRTAMTYQETI